MATATSPTANERVMLRNISWKRYEELLNLLADQHVHVTYDRGNLEIMTLSHEHESLRYLLARLVDALTEELGLPVKGGGSTTYRKEVIEKGLEPDASWWIANERLVRGKTEIDLTDDPPPDLVVEIEVTRSALNRMSIYSRLRVPEVWRYDGATLTFQALQSRRKAFRQVRHSLSFPSLTADDLLPFLQMRGQYDENAIVRQFRQWIRQHLSAGGQPASNP